MRFIYAILAAFGLCFTQAVQSQSETIAQKLPLFTPFNWAASSVGYIVKGEVCNNVSGIGPTGCGPATFVFDPANERMIFDTGSKGGTNYILKDTSYIYGPDPTQPNVCYQVPGFSFKDETTNYQNALSMRGSNQNQASYFGRVLDVASCKDKIAVQLITVHKNSTDVLSEFNYAQLYPIDGLGCQYVTGTLKFKVKKVDFKSDRNPYFDNMPGNCTSSAPSFCETIYHPGNPCEGQIKTG